MAIAPPKFDSKPQTSGRSLHNYIDKAKLEPPTCDNGAHIATIKGGLQIRTGKGGEWDCVRGNPKTRTPWHRLRVGFGGDRASKGAKRWFPGVRARCVAPGEGYQALKDLVRSRRDLELLEDLGRPEEPLFRREAATRRHLRPLRSSDDESSS